MRSSKLFHAVDSHTEGMPTRVVTGGAGTIPGETMIARRDYFVEHLDHWRRLLAPEADERHTRHAMVVHPGWFDRSPFGTGTSARMAQLHSRGRLPLHTELVSESFIGTRFTGRLIGEATIAGVPAVLPTITGRAWITGTAQYLLDPTDPFPAGFDI